MNSRSNKKKATLKRAAPKAKSAAPRRQVKSQPKNVIQSVSSSYFKQTGPRKPNIRNGSSKGDARVLISHSEYIGVIAGSTAFAVTEYPINPGLAAMFPWLSQMASNYECYRFRKLKFEFKTLASSATVGSILMAVDYDAADDPPVNYQMMTNYNQSLDSQVWSPETCMICDKADLNKSSQKYIRQGTLASNLDIKTYDIGNFYLATQDMAGTNNVGRLWVEYEVELITPQSIFAFNSLQSAKIVSGGTVSKTAYLGTVPVITGSLAVTAVTNTITFNQPGEYILAVSVIGTGVGNNAGNSGTATVTEVYTQYSAATVGMEIDLIRVTEVGQTFILDWSAETTVSSSVVRIAPYSYILA